MAATAIAMPKLGMTMEEGRVVAWPIPVGGRVEKGRTVLVIESEKTEADIEATASGVLRHVYVPADETVPCGTLLGAITESADEPFDAAAFAASHRSAGPLASRAGGPARSEPQASEVLSGRHALAFSARSGPLASEGRGRRSDLPEPSSPRRPIAPAARARARELGVDVERVPGPGPGGRVTREDVAGYAASRARLRAGSGGVALEVPTEGQGPAVVLLPGFGTDVSSFARLAPALAGHFAVLGVNPRGVGLSEAPALSAYDVATAAEDVAALAPPRFHAVGASLGAAVALELALRHPDRVDRLVLLTPFVAARPRLLAVLDLWTRLAAETGPETLARVLLPWLFSEGLLADASARERTVRGLGQTVARVPAAVLERTAAGLRAWSGTRGADLALVAAPTLVVEAGADLLAPDAGRIAAALPKARLVRAPDAGHAVALEAAELVNEALLEHLSGP